ncbi:hypothetical protein, partial [Streptococcus pyogenes]|uniref:hypothetical protein n=1 Tax=Streptococcus pyogenes TaxID=1314 RepID=UPI003D010C59
ALPTLLHVVSFPLQQTTRLNFHNLLSLLQLLVYPPLCANNEEDRPATAEEIAGYESLASLFAGEEMKLREATLEERFTWLDS